MIGLEHYLILSGVLFSIGLFGALSKRNIITVLMSVELMFNAVIVAVVAMSKFILPRAAVAVSPTEAGGVAAPLVLSGHVFAIFVITIAAAEIALGLALVIAIYRHQETMDISQVSQMKR